MDKQEKVYTDEELKNYVYELKLIIRKLLFQPLEHTDHFRFNVSEEEKQKVLNEYITEKINLEIF